MLRASTSPPTLETFVADVGELAAALLVKVLASVFLSEVEGKAGLPSRVPLDGIRAAKYIRAPLSGGLFRADTEVLHRQPHRTLPIKVLPPGIPSIGQGQAGPSSGHLDLNRIQVDHQKLVGDLPSQNTRLHRLVDNVKQEVARG